MDQQSSDRRLPQRKSTQREAAMTFFPFRLTTAEDMATSLAAEAARPFRFDPAAPVSPLAARLLAASNGLHNHPSDGVPPAEPFTSRHARKP
jgi:hypothetical protein